jgi:hypothetical protein
VPEVGREQRHPRLDVDAGAIPIEHRVHGEVWRTSCNRGRQRADRGARPATRVSSWNVALMLQWQTREPRPDRNRAGERGRGHNRCRRCR